jgi:hypothetical protein
MADYLLSNNGSRQPLQSASSLSKEALAALQGVQAGFLDRCGPLIRIMGEWIATSK